MTRSSKTDTVYITGLGHQYPAHVLKQEQFRDLLECLYPEEVSSTAVQKLIHFNTKTGILSRPTIVDHSSCTTREAGPPTITSISRNFRTAGIELAAAACKKAMREAQLSPKDVTHVVAVTCTDQGNPGYDLFVCEKLGLEPSVQRVLLQGVGCAGGLAASRNAADIAAAALQKSRPARVLVMACELCSLFLHAELQHALRSGDELHIAPTLFSDAAAAMVVCNSLAINENQAPVFELREWGSMAVPGTSGFMSYDIEKNGMVATISKDVPKAAISAINPMFDQLCGASGLSDHLKSPLQRDPTEFDWAIHPGGAAILQGAKRSLHLTDDHIKASLDVYKHYGNSSSATVLIVLDKMRRMGEGRDDVVATSFGPGLTVEMCMMTRCRDVARPGLPFPASHSRMYAFWLALQSRVSKRAARRSSVVMKDAGRRRGGYTAIV